MRWLLVIFGLLATWNSFASCGEIRNRREREACLIAQVDLLSAKVEGMKSRVRYMEDDYYREFTIHVDEFRGTTTFEDLVSASPAPSSITEQTVGLVVHGERSGPILPLGDDTVHNLPRGTYDIVALTNDGGLRLMRSLQIQRPDTTGTIWCSYRTVSSGYSVVDRCTFRGYGFVKPSH